MFSRSCSALEAPVMTLLTCGFFKHQAMASCASVIPNWEASSPSRSTFSIVGASPHFRTVVAASRSRAAKRGYRWECLDCIRRSVIRRPAGTTWSCPNRIHDTGAPDSAPRFRDETGCIGAVPWWAAQGRVLARGDTLRGWRRRSIPMFPSKALCPVVPDRSWRAQFLQLACRDRVGGKNKDRDTPLGAGAARRDTLQRHVCGSNLPGSADRRPRKLYWTQRTCRAASLSFSKCFPL